MTGNGNNWTGWSVMGGYIPMLDGRVRADIPFENYAFYKRLLEKTMLLLSGDQLGVPFSSELLVKLRTPDPSGFIT